MKSLASRILITYLALVVAGVGGLVIWAGLRLQRAEFAYAERDVERQAVLIAGAVAQRGEHLDEGGLGREAIASLAESYARDIGGYVAVWDARRRLLAASGTGLAPDANSPALRSALSGLTSTERVVGDERDWLLAAAPVRGEEARPAALVEVGTPLTPTYDAVRRMWLGLGAVAVVATSVAGIAGVLLARSVARPLSRLTGVSGAMAAGDLTQRVTPDGPDEVRRLAVAFNEMAGRLEAAMARQRAFVAEAAHELRTPLTSIRLRLDMLGSHAQSDPAVRARYIAQLDDEVRHLQRLVDHLLDLARLDQSRDLPKGPVDLAPLLYDIAEEMTPLADHAGLRLVVDVPAHTPVIDGNADALRSAVRNLLDNAVRHTPAGGRVTLRAATTDGAIEVAVADTGEGIAQEHLPRIFDRFYRVDKARSRRAGGAGLGLSLVRSVVDAHGGKVTVESAPGKGSTFTILLPLDTIPGSAPTANETRSGSAGRDNLADREYQRQ